MATIYGLVSNRNNEVFYVGKTYRDESVRINEHYRNTKRLEHRVYRRINRDRKSGFDIYHVVLEKCSFDQLDERESYWIRGLPNLENERRNGWGSLSKEETARIEAIRESQRGGVPNWCGHIGVLHYPRFDVWKVQVLHWGNFYVLPRNFRDGVASLSG